MLNITVVNCDDNHIVYEWKSKEEFVADIDSDNQNIPMLDDVICELETDEDEIFEWWRDTSGMIVDDLYCYVIQQQ